MDETCQHLLSNRTVRFDEPKTAIPLLHNTPSNASLIQTRSLMRLNQFMMARRSFCSDGLYLVCFIWICGHVFSITTNSRYSRSSERIWPEGTIGIPSVEDQSRVAQHQSLRHQEVRKLSSSSETLPVSKVVDGGKTITNEDDSIQLLREREQFTHVGNGGSIHPERESVQEKDVDPQVSFASLHMCSKSHGSYHCLNSDDCETSACLRNESRKVATRYQPRILAEFHQQAFERKRLLGNILDRIGVKDRVMVFILNAGFAHLFGNWYCGLSSRFNMDEIRKQTLVLPADEQARVFVQSLGLVAPTLEEFQVLKKWTHRSLVAEAADAFARGSHSALNQILKIGLPLDLLGLNRLSYIGIFDVDLLWRAPDVFDLMIDRCESSRCDFAFAHEGRDFRRDEFAVSSTEWIREGDVPEFNTGMILMNAKSIAAKEAMRTVFQGHHLQQWKARDQPLFNSVLYHKAFEGRINIALLPRDEFVPGIDINWRIQTNRLEIPDVVKSLHISDTGSYRSKIKRLKAMGFWYFTLETCSEPFRVCSTMPSCIESIRLFEQFGTGPIIKATPSVDESSSRNDSLALSSDSGHQKDAPQPLAVTT